MLQGNNALHYAVSFRNWKIVDVLLGTGLMNLNLPNKVTTAPFTRPLFEVKIFLPTKLLFTDGRYGKGAVRTDRQDNSPQTESSPCLGLSLHKFGLKQEFDVLL